MTIRNSNLHLGNTKIIITWKKGKNRKITFSDIHYFLYFVLSILYMLHNLICMHLQHTCRTIVKSLIYKGKTSYLETFNRLCQQHSYRRKIIWMTSFLPKLIRIRHHHAIVGGDWTQISIWPFLWAWCGGCWNSLLIKEFRNSRFFSIFLML